MPPTGGQLALLILAIALFFAGGVVSLLRIWSEGEPLRIAAKACMWCGVFTSLAVLVWHAIRRPGGTWLPLEDNFEAFLCLAVLLSGFVMYVQRRKPVGGLEWFVMPVVIVMLTAAAVLGEAKPQQYTADAWSWVHRATSYLGALGFAIAGAGGALYILASRRLRRKQIPHGPRMPSLERLEKITFTSVTLGFALLTIGLVTGIVRIMKEGGKTALGPNPYASPKVLLAFAVWVVYAVVLHAPIHPSFRGRKVALLSIVGCVLMIGTLVAVSFMPGGSK